MLRQAVEKRVRALVGRLKTHPAYTQTLGEQLGIIAPEAQTSELKAMNLSSQDAQPRLTGMVTPDGRVAVKFAKNGFTGVLIYARRGGEGEFVLLAKQLRSPFVDARESLTTGQPETRKYRAVYLENDQPAGMPSDTLAVTVPAAMRIAAADPSAAIQLTKAA